MAGTMWFHYARDFLPQEKRADWSRAGGFPRNLLWQPSDGKGPFYRKQVLLEEIRSLRADLLCLVELDCFSEFKESLDSEGYDAVFHKRPGRKEDGCGIFWRRSVFASAGPCKALVYKEPAEDRIALVQPVRHLETQRLVTVVSTHLYWDQSTGHQLSEAKELLSFIANEAQQDSAILICGDMNTTPHSDAYKILRERFADAAVEEPASAHYASGSFTTLKPPVYYFAKPLGHGQAPQKVEQWHEAEGRQHVIDYIFYDPALLQVREPAVIPCMASEPPKKKRRVSEGAANFNEGFCSGAWDLKPVTQQVLQARLRDPSWTPPRKTGEPQSGIPNRRYGSDHVPVVCELSFRDVVPAT
eukprot:CAMPEP_0194520120 /NCGR_PEP_ID=MMETSP0253-20130528/53995_1 /TAXON_ID=2966 /ORGANISM="Noctiluca scintillans" /LENGTH=357 /DNA_ID=CAMNT_0039364323 /DNA_START=45 /DNA_END=1114 /DNA_ORIENTATION=+